MKKKFLVIALAFILSLTAFSLVGCANKNHEPEELKPFIYEKVLNRYTIKGVKDTTAKQIVVPNYVTNIAVGAFAGCSNLEKLTMPFVGDASRCEYSENIYPLGYIFGRTSFYGAVATHQQYKEGTNYKSEVYYIPQNLTEVVITGGQYIPKCAFLNATMIKKITLTDSVETIGESAFANCSSLEQINIPSCAKQIHEGAFSGCNSLKTVSITNEKKYAQIKFGDENSSPSTFAKKLYKNGALLTAVDLSGLNKISAYAFNQNGALKVVKVDDNLVNVGAGAFNGCTNLNKTIAQSLSGWLKINFNNYSANPVYSSENLYIGNRLLTNLTVPNDITAIKPFAFRNCKSLISVTLPSQVENIGEYAFFGCVKLFEVYDFAGLSLTAGESSNGCVAGYAQKINTSETSSIYTEQNGFITANHTTYGKTLIAYTGNQTAVTIPNDITAVCDYALYPNAEISQVNGINSIENVGINALPKGMNN